MYKKRRILSAMLAVCLVLVSLLTGCSEKTATNEKAATNNSTAKQVIPMYAPGSGSAAYFLAAGIASIVSKNVPSMQLAAEATTGATEMVKLLDERNKNGKPAFAVITSDATFSAYKGVNEYKQAYPSLRAVAFLYGAELLLVVPKNSPIQTWADVKGKKIGVGAPGSGVFTMTNLVIAKHGVKSEEFKPLPLGYTEVVQGITDGSIDGGILAAASYNELATSKEIRLIPIDSAVADDIIKDKPYYYKSVVKAGAYKGVTNDVPVLSFGILINTHEKTSDELVYNLIKTTMEKHDDLVAIHASGKQMTPKSVLNSIGIPLHPGAEKYYKEAGIK